MKNTPAKTNIRSVVLISLIAISSMGVAKRAHAGDAAGGAEGETSICSQIPCSGHGRCIEVNDRAACVCDAGYQPDAVNGLHCISATVTGVVSPAAKSEAQIKEELDILLDDDSFETIFAGYRHAQQDSGYVGSAADYFEQVYTRRKRLGYALTAVGITVLGPVPFFAAFSPVEEEIFLPAMSVCAVTGTAMTVVGALLAKKNGTRALRLQHLNEKDKTCRVTFEGVGLLAAPHMKGTGVELGFSF